MKKSLLVLQWSYGLDSRLSNEQKGSSSMVSTAILCTFLRLQRTVRTSCAACRNKTATRKDSGGYELQKLLHFWAAMENRIWHFSIWHFRGHLRTTDNMNQKRFGKLHSLLPSPPEAQRSPSSPGAAPAGMARNGQVKRASDAVRNGHQSTWPKRTWITLGNLSQVVFLKLDLLGICVEIHWSKTSP